MFLCRTSLVDFCFASVRAYLFSLGTSIVAPCLYFVQALVNISQSSNQSNGTTRSCQMHSHYLVLHLTSRTWRFRRHVFFHVHFFNLCGAFCRFFLFYSRKATTIFVQAVVGALLCSDAVPSICSPHPDSSPRFLFLCDLHREPYISSPHVFCLCVCVWYLPRLKTFS